MHLGQLDNAYISIQCPTNDESCHQLRASLMMNFNPCYDPVGLNMEMYLCGISISKANFIISP